MYAVIDGSLSNSCKANFCSCWWYLLVSVLSSPLNSQGKTLKEKTLGAKYRTFGLSPFFERLTLTGCTLVVWHHNTKHLQTIFMYTVSHYLFSFHRLLHSNAIKKIDVRPFAGLNGLKSFWVLYDNWINVLVILGGQYPFIHLILSNVNFFVHICEEIRVEQSCFVCLMATLLPIGSYISRLFLPLSVLLLTGKLLSFTRSCNIGPVYHTSLN